MRDILIVFIYAIYIYVFLLKKKLLCKNKNIFFFPAVTDMRDLWRFKDDKLDGVGPVDNRHFTN